MFRKNSIEFFIGLTTYLYYFYKWLYTTSPQSHDLVMWYDYLSFFAIYILSALYDLIFIDQVFECMGNLFLLRALITPWQI